MKTSAKSNLFSNLFLIFIFMIFLKIATVSSQSTEPAPINIDSRDISKEIGMEDDFFTIEIFGSLTKATSDYLFEDKVLPIIVNKELTKAICSLEKEIDESDDELEIICKFRKDERVLEDIVSVVVLKDTENDFINIKEELEISLPCSKKCITCYKGEKKGNPGCIQCDRSLYFYDYAQPDGTCDCINDYLYKKDENGNCVLVKEDEANNKTQQNNVTIESNLGKDLKETIEARKDKNNINNSNSGNYLKNIIIVNIFFILDLFGL